MLKIFLLQDNAIYKMFNFCYSLWIFFYFSWFNVTVIAYWKQLLYFLLMGFIAAFLFFIQSGKSIYDPPRLKFILWQLWYNNWTESKTNPLLFIDSQLLWYLSLSESKTYFITSSSLIMISVFSLFECITRSSSLSKEEIKLFGIVNWIFYESDFFRLSLISFKYGLILLRYSSTNSISFLLPILSFST